MGVHGVIYQDGPLLQARHTGAGNERLRAEQEVEL